MCHQAPVVLADGVGWNGAMSAFSVARSMDEQCAKQCFLCMRGLSYETAQTEDWMVVMGGSVESDSELPVCDGCARPGNSDAGNACAEGGQLSLILGGQFSDLTATAQASAEVHTDMAATIQQYRTANN